MKKIFIIFILSAFFNNNSLYSIEGTDPYFEGLLGEEGLLKSYQDVKNGKDYYKDLFANSFRLYESDKLLFIKYYKLWQSNFRVNLISELLTFGADEYLKAIRNYNQTSNIEEAKESISTIQNFCFILIAFLYAEDPLKAREKLLDFYQVEQKAHSPSQFFEKAFPKEIKIIKNQISRSQSFQKTKELLASGAFIKFIMLAGGGTALIALIRKLMTMDFKNIKALEFSSNPIIKYAAKTINLWRQKGLSFDVKKQIMNLINYFRRVQPTGTS